MRVRLPLFTILVLLLAVATWSLWPQPAGAQTLPETTTTTEPPPETTTTTEPAPETTTTTEAPSGPPVARHLSVDVVVYGTTSSGIGAAWALEEAARDLGVELSVAHITPSGGLESPMANGLGVEDVYGGDAAVNGFARVIRNEIVRRYELEGIFPLEGGRLTYEPEMGHDVLSWFYDREGFGRPGVTYLEGALLAADDGSVIVDDSRGPTRVSARYFIDGSAEGDLTRLLGAPYRVGMSETVYSGGQQPPRPSALNNWETAPQFYSALLTFSVQEDTATPIAEQTVPYYSPSSYGPDAVLPESVRAGFGTSWSMKWGLPNGKHELNEAWSDYDSLAASYDWVFDPDQRPTLHGRFVTHAVNHLRWLQENGYPNIGLAKVPDYPYVREGIRAVGRTYYQGSDIDARAKDEPIAYGVYARYDRHDDIPRFVTQYQDPVSTAVWVPMGALQLLGHPNHLVSTAISADESAYNSSVRMEWTRANMGGAAGVMVAVAEQLGVDVAEVPYESVAEELNALGWQFGPQKVVQWFSDVPNTSEYYAPIKYLAQLGIIGGYADNTFAMYDPVRRAQLAKMVVLALGVHDKALPEIWQNTFPDVLYDGNPYPFDYVEEAVAAGLIAGFKDGTFGPWKDLTRVQLVRIMVRAGGDALEKPPADYAMPFKDLPTMDRDTIAVAVYNGLVNGKSTEVFDPYGNAARAHVAKILYNFLTGGTDGGH